MQCATTCQRDFGHNQRDSRQFEPIWSGQSDFSLFEPTRLGLADLGNGLADFWWPNPPSAGPPSVGLPSVGPPSVGPPKISRFFSFSRSHFHSFLLSLGMFSYLFLSLRVSSRGILVVYWSVGTSNVFIFALGLSCGSPRGCIPPGAFSSICASPWLLALWSSARATCFLTRATYWRHKSNGSPTGSCMHPCLLQNHFQKLCTGHLSVTSHFTEGGGFG